MRAIHRQLFGTVGFAVAVLISAPVTLLLRSGPPAEAPSVAVTGQPKTPVSSTQRTPCYEQVRIRLTLSPHTDVPCPDYAIEISGDGDVKFEGKYFTRVLGVHHHKIPEATVRRLIAEAYRIGFFSYADQYLERDLGNGCRETVDHAVGYTIEVQTAADYKSVYHFFGGPGELEVFKDDIVDAGDPFNWREAHFDIR